MIEIEAALRPGRPGAPEVPGALRDRLLALRLLRPVRRGLPRGRDPHGQGSARPARLRPRPACGSRKDELLELAAAAATSPSPTRRRRRRPTEARHDRRAARRPRHAAAVRVRRRRAGRRAC
ncbi:MAG: hypothetical protein MZV64_44670 [Ignavibacteriales bacterium]|nr:hypothetical protein [Ignavibacteriales bacterium]